MQASSDTADGISRAQLYVGDLRAVLPGLGKDIAQAVITSPPYWGLRDYGLEPQVWGGDAEHGHEWLASSEVVRWQTGKWKRQRESGYTAETDIHTHGPRGDAFCQCGAWLGSLGLEPTPELYVEHIVECFRAVRLALKPSGVLWLNIGDSYAGSGNGSHDYRERNKNRSLSLNPEKYLGQSTRSLQRIGPQEHTEGAGRVHGYKPKDLIGIPWMVAFALRADGWYLRMDCIWHKPNPMPESVTDRPTRSHEYVFLFSKSRTYYYDALAVAEAYSAATLERSRYSWTEPDREDGRSTPRNSKRWNVTNRDRRAAMGGRDGRNKRSVWTIATQPFPGAHFATFPASLVEDPIKASTRPGDVVLDPFCGAGTVGLVAARLGRDFIGIDLKASYVQMAQRRILDDAPMLNEVTI